jgi:hypothetical protein
MSGFSCFGKQLQFSVEEQSKPAYDCCFLVIVPLLFAFWKSLLKKMTAY